MFKKILIFGAGTLYGACSVIDIVFTYGLMKRNVTLEKELKELKASKTKES